MGQDFVARKAAKKQRKRQARDAETGRKTKRKRKEDGFEVADDDGLGMTAEQVKRRRKKGNNVSLRISRALCYKPPQLTAEDLQWDGTAEGGEDDGRGNNPYSFNDMAEAGYDSDVEEALQKQPQQQQQKQPSLQLSTAVNLLDPAAAAKLAGKKQPKQQQQQQAGSKPGQQQPQQQQQLDDAVAAAPALQGLVDSGLNPLVARCMAKLGFMEPTPIQSACWGPACAGQDVLGHAEPGSGKTLAYLLPAFAHLATSSSSSSRGRSQHQQQDQQAEEGEAAVQPRVLVLLPSRELAQQVHSQCTALFSVTGVSSAVLYGGVPKEQQVDILQRRQPQLIVATPGRLLDLLDSGVLSFARISCAVLDEADKMLSVGFEPQLQRLKALLLDRHAGAAAEQGGAGRTSSSKLKGTKQGKMQKQQAGSSGAPAPAARCQVLLFSATLPKAVRQTADAWLARGYKAVSCSAGADSISQTITQVVQVCAEHKKPAKLLKHLAAIKEASQGLRNPPRVLVFANRIKRVLFVHRTLTEAGYRAVMLHGKRSQPERDAAVAGFKAGKAQVLVASDVASRGLDIRGLPYVVNYDFPSNLEVYIHRVGRTGRLAAAGHAFSFFTRPLAKLAAPLVDLLRAHNQAVDPNLLQLSEAWAQAEAALAAQGKSPAALEAAAAAAADGQEEEEEEEDSKLEAGAAAAAALPEDLQEGLLEEQRAALAAAAGNNTNNTSNAQQQQQLLQQQQQSKRASKKHAGDALMVPQGPSSTAGAVAGNGGANAATDQTTAAAGAAAPPFIPALKFAGAKVGYAFKKGPRGVGYYVDSVQQLAKQQQKQARKQEHQKALQQALKQYKQQQGQQGQQMVAAGSTQAAANKGSSKGAAAAGKKSQAAGAAAGGGGSSSSSKPAASELPPLPGLAKKRKLPAFMTSGDLSDDDGGAGVLERGSSGSGSGSDGDNDDDSDDEMGGGRGGSLQQRLQLAGISSGGGNKRRKALPGRLRKKLAKDAAGGGAAGGKKGPGGKKGGGARKQAGAKWK